MWTRGHGWASGPTRPTSRGPPGEPSPSAVSRRCRIRAGLRLRCRATPIPTTCGLPRMTVTAGSGTAPRGSTPGRCRAPRGQWGRKDRLVSRSPAQGPKGDTGTGATGATGPTGANGAASRTRSRWHGPGQLAHRSHRGDRPHRGGWCRQHGSRPCWADRSHWPTRHPRRRR